MEIITNPAVVIRAAQIPIQRFPGAVVSGLNPVIRFYINNIILLKVKIRRSENIFVVKIYSRCSFEFHLSPGLSKHFRDDHIQSCRRLFPTLPKH